MKQTIAELRASIAKHTGKIPKSEDVDYLARRLASLNKRKRSANQAEGRHADKSTTDDPSEVLSVSMPGTVKLAVIRIAGGEQMGVSQLVRRALGEYASRRGYGAEAQHFEEG